MSVHLSYDDIIIISILTDLFSDGDQKYGHEEIVGFRRNVVCKLDDLKSRISIMSEVMLVVQLVI